MAKTYDEIGDDHTAFIAAQQIFFVGSAPLGAEGHVNLSPKGLDCFRVLSPHRVAYLDLTGSGAETAAHLRENGRITIMFCAFSGPPMILRLYGRGETVLPGEGLWNALVESFDPYPGARQIVVAAIDRVQTSCGFGVPRYAYVEQRDTLVRWAEAKGEDGLEEYRALKNARSLDGLLTPFAAARVEPSR